MRIPYMKDGRQHLTKHFFQRAMQYHILTLKELDAAWEVTNKMEIQEKDEASVTTVETLVVSLHSHFMVSVDLDEQTWESPTDPENPKNWSCGRKWLNVLIVSLQATLTTAACSILATGSIEMSDDLHVFNIDVVGLPIAVFVLGFGAGPLFLAPLSERFGRRILYLISLAAFTILSIGCALSPSISVLIILRLLAGIAGSASPSLGAGSVGDMFEEKDLGRAQALYAFGPTNGAVLGALIGGFIVADTHQWRWLMWAIAIAAGIMTIISIIFLRESYGPLLLAQKAERLRQAIGNGILPPKIKLDQKELFTVTLTRPLRLLLFAPICTLLSLYMGL
jgi:multidrug resistance protein